MFVRMLHLPKTVRYALAVLTGMVKREQVYMPSSDRVTSLILMVNSDHDARTSSILLSLKARQRDRELGKITKNISKVKVMCIISAETQ